MNISNVLKVENVQELSKTHQFCRLVRIISALMCQSVLLSAIGLGRKCIKERTDGQMFLVCVHTLGVCIYIYIYIYIEKTLRKKKILEKHYLA
jgi:hypothetical protein